MRLRHHSGRTVHLSQGVDLRTALDMPAVVEQLDTSAAAVRTRLRVDTLGVSLGLPAALAAMLAVDARARARLRAELDARGLEVVTLNGVRCGDGEPDWSNAARLDYTLDLARVLVDLLPDDMVRGAVSTVGFGRRDGWDAGKDRSCSRMLGRLAGGLAEVAWQTGRAVRVGFQPQTGNVLDTAANTAAGLAKVDRERLGVCLDLASLACTWEHPADALDTLADNGIPVIQVQVPLHAAPPSPLAATAGVSWAALRHLLRGSHPATEYLEVPPEDWGGLATTNSADDVAAELVHVIGELSDLGVDARAYSSS